jgi:hypothetical protein
VEGRNNGNVAVALESLSYDTSQYLTLKGDMTVCDYDTYQYSSAHFIPPYVV